jgi:triosephosphate isomerase
MKLSVSRVAAGVALVSSAQAFTQRLGLERISSSLFARKPFISGNWKLNPQTKAEAVALATNIASKITPTTPNADIALFVPYVFIEAAMESAAGKFTVGAEGVCPEIKGAFTGAVSATMLHSVGVQWALAGHSERRVIFGETDEYINGQCLKLIQQGMSVMLCIGESEREYEQNLAGPVCAVQLKKGLAGIRKEDMDRVAIAYEPVWAIGTGTFLLHALSRKPIIESGN